MIFNIIIMANLRGGETFQIYCGAKPEILKLASELRHNMTPQERILWDQLRRRNLLGFKFRRQHPFNVLILDFFCYDARLSVEVDGTVHNDSYQRERDIERTSVLKKFGITELRFSNWEVEYQIDKVLDKIKQYLETCSLPPGGGRVGDGG
jgi:very-short-patch-repair endonuclease